MSLLARRYSARYSVTGLFLEKPWISQHILIGSHTEQVFRNRMTESRQPHSFE